MKDRAEKDIPMEPVFEYNCLNLAGEPSGCPVCPVCREPTYSLQRCPFCGQLFKTIRKD